MADSVDDDFEKHMAEARKAAKAAATAQSPAVQPPAAASPAPADPESAQFEQHMTAARAAQPPPEDPATVAARQPPEPQTTGMGIARNVAAGVIDAARNVANVITDPEGNLIGRPLTTMAVFGHDLLAPVFGYPRFSPEDRNLLLGDNVPQPGTRIVSTVGNALGVDPDKVAATPTESLVRTAVGGAGAAAALGPGGLGPRVVPALAGGSGAVTGDLAAAYVPDWMKPAATLAGNVAGGYAGGKIAAESGRAANLVTGVTSPILDAYKRLQVDPTLLGDVSQNPTAKAAQAYAQGSTFAAGVVDPKVERVVKQFGNAVEQTARSVGGPTGGSTTAEAAGNTLQTEARNWRDNVFPAREAAAWAPVDQAMAGATVDPAHYRAALQTLTSKLAALPETQKALLPQRMQTMLEALDKDVPPGGTISWKDAQNLRTAIGQIMGVPEIVQSVGKNQLKAAYGGISEDMRTAAVNNGADLLFAAANKVSTEGHAFIDNTLSKIIRSNNPAQETVRPEQATKSILGGGDTTLQAVRAELPKAADDLAAYKLRDMALATPGQAGATGGETSIGTFLTELNRMRQGTPGGFNALFGDPAVAQRVADLATVADSVKATARKLNTSRSGPYIEGASMIPLALQGYYAGGIPGAVAAAGTPMAAGRLAGYAVTNPALTRYVSTPAPAVPNPLVAGVIANLESEDRKNALAAKR